MENDDSIEPDKLSSSSSHHYNNNKITNFLSPSMYFQYNQPLASGISSEARANSSEVSGKVLFTVTQWQELERQMMIYKYIMASIPVPHHLLIPLSTQSNKGGNGMGMDLRFSNGSDPEPWRCRRTDGKKWRCSRDVAPDQKYCERHAHKNRPRSRKPVEIQSHVNVMTPSSRSTEWFIKSGAIPVSSSSLQFHQSMNSNSPRVGSKRTHIVPQENLQLDSAGARRQQFIDAWSKAGDGDNCSLTLSMQCGAGAGAGGFDGNNDGSNDHGFDTEDVLKSHSQWLSHGSSMGPPGGPLGEALGLGIASTVIGPSTHGHSSSTSTTTNELSFIR